MKIYNVTDPEFIPYGRVLHDAAFGGLIEALASKPMPEDSTIYVPGDPDLEETDEGRYVQDVIFGEIPMQIGYCNGFNTKLNALEYHRCSEINFAQTDAILLLGRQQDITPEMTYDTGKVMAFLVPAGTTVEVYATSLHYAPCVVPGNKGFRVGVILAKGTNYPLQKEHDNTEEDRHLTATNKWLLGHPEGVGEGSPLGLIGRNWDVAAD